MKNVFRLFKHCSKGDGYFTGKEFFIVGILLFIYAILTSILFVDVLDSDVLFMLSVLVGLCFLIGALSCRLNYVGYPTRYLYIMFLPLGSLFALYLVFTKRSGGIEGVVKSNWVLSLLSVFGILRLIQVVLTVLLAMADGV